ncbi:transcriptional regulator [Novosphingobium sediminicola]|uniref:DNA-binding transcriptional regulator YdaS (Cro superfamily) n=1 Tax=Novosphingobium sediminicola TaxID=563162 RepID=A0A7W6CBA8_9SPHN|nr:YdaS family helix-turn-helix protein [Novosphingobium sediminicola]MBB3953418.1 DNA-binding transcriptional regulator YdaS (Cro superfamily) [Novosphingobium sediminicola]
MSNAPTPFEALQAALNKAGSQSALARICGVSQPTVWKWLQTRRLPPIHVLAVETATGISRHHLRPDIYPAEIPAAPARFLDVDHGASLVAFNRGTALRDGASA